MNNAVFGGDIPRCHLGGFYDIISLKRDWRLQARA